MFYPSVRRQGSEFGQLGILRPERINGTKRNRHRKKRIIEQKTGNEHYEDIPDTEIEEPEPDIEIEE
jgi:hypothetical protein